VPRLLERDDETGLLLQTPVPELEQLRGSCCDLTRSGKATVSGRHADVLIEGICGEGSLILDNSLEIWFSGQRFGVRYLVETHSGGRSERSISLDKLCDLRVLVDGSAVEVYANGGSYVFSSRWFCEERTELTVVVTFACETGRIWTMEDVLGEMYATAKAPDLAFGGRVR
jgi:beta-fructofuranosidase